MKIWKSIKKIFGPHYAMERFGVLFLSLSLCMGILLISINIKVSNDKKVNLSEQVIYTTSTTTSLTGQTGAVHGIYHNTDRTKCFILLKFEDMSSMSINAEYYQMFVTGFSPNQEQQELLKVPSGCIYVLGSSGYMGIYLTSAGGFEEQIMGLTVRCNKTIVDTTISNASSTYMDASFDSYDQFRIYFNPGGKAVTVATSLDKDRLNIFELYEELVTQSQEKQIREQLMADLENMYITQTAMEEYEERLIREGVGSYTIPSQIDGDVVELDEEGIYHLKTDYVIPTGLDFEWYDGSIHDGYLADLKGALSNDDYLDALESEIADPEDAFTTDIVWYLTDGSTFNGEEYTNATLDETSYKELSSAVNLLTSAWSDFYTTKQQYQCVDLVKLLTLEKEAREVQEHYTINVASNVLQAY